MTTLEPASPTTELPLLDAKNLVQRYGLPRESLFRPRSEVLALNGVTARVMAGKSLGVVGESGIQEPIFPHRRLREGPGLLEQGGQSKENECPGRDLDRK